MNSLEAMKLRRRLFGLPRSHEPPGPYKGFKRHFKALKVPYKDLKEP